MELINCGHAVLSHLRAEIRNVDFFILFVNHHVSIASVRRKTVKGVNQSPTFRTDDRRKLKCGGLIRDSRFI